jgi:hypothetical protein
VRPLITPALQEWLPAPTDSTGAGHQPRCDFFSVLHGADDRWWWSAVFHP